MARATECTKMATTPVIPASKFDPTTLKFGQPEKNRNGGKFVPIVDDAGNKIRVKVQTPTLHLPFGIAAYPPPKEGKPVQNYSLDVSFRADDDPRVSKFLETMKDLDEYLIDQAIQNSVAWFGKQKTREVLEDAYRPLTKAHPEGKYPPVMKVKSDLSRRDGKPVCKFFDAQTVPAPGQPPAELSIDDVPPGCSVKLIMEVSQVWQVNNTWGVTWRALQCMVVSKPTRLDAFAFQNDDEDMDCCDDAGAEDFV